jgi:hypothetical protein
MMKPLKAIRCVKGGQAGALALDKVTHWVVASDGSKVDVFVQGLDEALFVPREQVEAVVSTLDEYFGLRARTS